MSSITAAPYLDKVKVALSPTVDGVQYPFSLSIIKSLREIAFPSQVTFFVGENGTGKSTILEAIAQNAGFGPEGGSKNIHFKTSDQNRYAGVEEFAKYCTLSWRIKPKDGYFFRAESFFTLANRIDEIAKHDFSIYEYYGGKSLHEQSHGESFLAFFKNRVHTGGFFILDEPEAALSPQRQLSLLAIIHELCRHSQTQFIIATHSPMLLAYPGATIYSCDTGVLESVAYVDTQHYQITKNFLDNPARYLRYLFEEY